MHSINCKYAHSTSCWNPCFFLPAERAKECLPPSTSYPFYSRNRVTLYCSSSHIPVEIICCKICVIISLYNSVPPNESAFYHIALNRRQKPPITHPDIMNFTATFPPLSRRKCLVHICLQRLTNTTITAVPTICIRFLKKPPATVHPATRFILLFMLSKFMLSAPCFKYIIEFEIQSYLSGNFVSIMLFIFMECPPSTWTFLIILFYLIQPGSLLVGRQSTCILYVSVVVFVHGRLQP